MANSDPSRLDRIEALVEKIGQRVDSNARAIEALSESNAEAQKERARVYEIMAELAQSHADLAESHATIAKAQARLAQSNADTKKEMYRMMGNFEQQNQQLSKRQGEIVDILKLLVNKQSN